MWIFCAFFFINYRHKQGKNVPLTANKRTLSSLRSSASAASDLLLPPDPTKHTFQTLPELASPFLSTKTQQRGRLEHAENPNLAQHRSTTQPRDCRKKPNKKKDRACTAPGGAGSALFRHTSLTFLGPRGAKRSVSRHEISAPANNAFQSGQEKPLVLRHPTSCCCWSRVR